MRTRFSSFVRNKLVLKVGLLLFACSLKSSAQLVRPLPQEDKRLEGVSEDWTTPSLSTSHLTQLPTPPPIVDGTHPGYKVEYMQMQWRPGDRLDLYVLKPDGVKNPPVILNLYGYPADADAYKMEIFQKELVKDGFAAVGFVSALTGHRYHDRPMKEWFLSELQESLATSAHDVQMILNYLEKRGDLDMKRVGMFGQGSGATIAILASGVDPRIKVLDVLDPWGDWPKWMAASPFPPPDERPDYLKPEFLKKIAPFETLDWMPRIQAKKFRLQQLLFGVDTPKGIKDELTAAAPPGTTIVFYKNLDEFKAAFPYSQNLDWMKAQLKALPGEVSGAGMVTSAQH